MKQLAERAGFHPPLRRNFHSANRLARNLLQITKLTLPVALCRFRLFPETWH